MLTLCHNCSLPRSLVEVNDTKQLQSDGAPCIWLHGRTVADGRCMFDQLTSFVQDDILIVTDLLPCRGTYPCSLVSEPMPPTPLNPELRQRACKR